MHLFSFNFQLNQFSVLSEHPSHPVVVCDGRRQLDKRLKTIKQRPKVHITPAGNGVGRRVLLPVRAGTMSCPTIVVVPVVVVVVAAVVVVRSVGYGKQTMQAFKHLCNIN